MTCPKTHWCLPLTGRWLAAVGLLFACGEETATQQGQLMLAVTTDLEVPRDVDGLKLEVLTFGSTQFSHSYELGPTGLRLPATLGIVAGDDPATPVTIRVIASRGTQARFVRDVVTTVPGDRLATLEVKIEWLCLDEVAESEEVLSSTCGEDQTCVAGECIATGIDSAELPNYRPAAVFGGGDGSGTGECFDTLACFAAGYTVSVDPSRCVAKGAAGRSSLEELSIALAPMDAEGICGTGFCLVPLDAGSDAGWHTQGEDVLLPPAVCSKLLDGDLLGVVATTACQQKTVGLPTCGPWSSIDRAGTMVAEAPSGLTRPGGTQAAGETVRASGAPPVPGGGGAEGGGVVGAESGGEGGTAGQSDIGTIAPVEQNGAHGGAAGAQPAGSSGTGELVNTGNSGQAPSSGGQATGGGVSPPVTIGGSPPVGPVPLGGVSAGATGGVGGMPSTGGTTSAPAGSGGTLTGGSIAGSGGSGTTTGGVSAGGAAAGGVAGSGLGGTWGAPPGTVTVAAPECYVDATSGNDSNSGLSADAAVASQDAVPADCQTVAFRRGSVFSEPLRLTGTATTFTNYGDTQDPLPAFITTDPVVDGASSPGITIDGLHLAGTRGDGTAVAPCVLLGSESRLLNSEVTDCETGVFLSGTGNLVQGNRIFDITVLTSLPPGEDPNALGGGIGVIVTGSNNEISYNQFANCKTEAEWTGGDCEGGALYVAANADGVLSGTSIHHNYSYGSCGFFEAGGAGTVDDTRVYYNVSVDSSWAMLLQLAETTLASLRFENNTFAYHEVLSSLGLIYGGELTPDTVFFTNNLVLLTDSLVTPLDPAITVSNTLILEYDPGVVNRAGVSATGFDLLAGSEAVNQGIILDHALDFLNRPVPDASGLTDVGAFEFQTAAP